MTNKDYEQYIHRLQTLLKSNQDDPEFTGHAKPPDSVFSNALKIVSFIGKNAKFCVTFDGKFQVLMNHYGVNKGVIVVEQNGYRCINPYENKNKFISSSYSEDKISSQIKRYMSQYI